MRVVALSLLLIAAPAWSAEAPRMRVDVRALFDEPVASFHFGVRDKGDDQITGRYTCQAGQPCTVAVRLPGVLYRGGEARAVFPAIWPSAADAR